jgi:hypothetical protein
MNRITLVLFGLLITMPVFSQAITDNNFKALWGNSITVQAEGGAKPKGFIKALADDFNEDGYPDFLSVYYDNDYENVVTLFPGQSDLNAISPILVGGTSEPFETGAMGTLDILKTASKKYLVAMTGGISYNLASSDYAADTKSVLYELDCTGESPAFTKKQDLDASGIRLGAIFFIDWNGDSKEDILILGLNKVYINNGDNTFATGQTVALPFITLDTATGDEAGNRVFIKAHKADLNNDGKTEIVATQAGAGGLKVISVNNGTPAVTDLTITPVVADQTLAWTSCSIGDLNGDGFIDIFAMNVNRSVDPWMFETVVYLNNGQGGFTEKVQSPLLIATQAAEVFIFDINGDQKNDIFHAGWNAQTHSREAANNNFDTKSYVCINDGSGAFQEYYSSFGMEDCPSSYRGGGIIADLNSDGKMDIVLTDNNLKIWPGLIENVVVTDIQTVKPLQPDVFAENHSIYVKNLTGTVTVWSIDGRRIASVKAAQETLIPVLPGVYIVAAGESISKLIVK